MELIQYFKQQEGKTLEFKENCSSLPKIVQTVVAFANTAGGSLIIGVRDKTKEVVGLSDPLKEEERLSNAFADGIRPLMIPDIGRPKGDVIGPKALHPDARAPLLTERLAKLVRDSQMHYGRN